MEANETRLRAMIERLADARRTGTQISCAEFSAGLAAPEDAYRVQDGVASALGWFARHRATAWKVGASARGAAPIAVPLPPQGVVASPARFASSTFHSIGIEAEIAFRFGAGVEAMPRGNDWHAWVEALVVTIEVVDSRFDDVAQASPLAKLADAQQHGALVVGSTAPTRELDWLRLRARVRRNGQVVADTCGGHPLGDPSALLPWLVRHAAARGRALASGDLATAGTWAGLVPAAPGDVIDVEFEGVGRASVRFD